MTRRTPKPDRDAPIGVFDSGVGGLTVVSALLRYLPNESILYLGDTARLPYGTKSPQTVARYTERNVRFLVNRGVKAVVVACNTASALSASVLSAGPGPDGPAVPIWGVVEPGAAAAVAAVRRGPVGVLATESTIRSGAYEAAIRGHRPGLTALGRPCPLFVPLVEEGWVDDPISEAVARRYLEPLLAAEVDTLVLGCTHYPLLTPVLRRVVGEGVALVDSAESVALRIRDELPRLGLGREAPADGGRHHLCVTDPSERFQRIAHRLLHHFHTADHDLEESVSLEWVEV
ncbi:MAG: glutamate racemase [Acidobacteriota bacterium]